MLKQVLVIIILLLSAIPLVSADKINQLTFSPDKECTADIILDINDYEKINSSYLMKIFFPTEIQKDKKIDYHADKGLLEFPGLNAEIDIQPLEIVCHDNNKVIVTPTSTPSSINIFYEPPFIIFKESFLTLTYNKSNDFRCIGSAKAYIKNLKLKTGNYCRSYLFPFDRYKLSIGFRFENEKVGFNIDDSKLISIPTLKYGIYIPNSGFLNYQNPTDFSNFPDERAFFNIKIFTKNANLFLKILFIIIFIVVIFFVLLSFTLLKDRLYDILLSILPFSFEFYQFVLNQEHKFNLFDFLSLFLIIAIIIKISIVTLKKKVIKVKKPKL